MSWQEEADLHLDQYTEVLQILAKSESAGSVDLNDAVNTLSQPQPEGLGITVRGLPVYPYVGDFKQPK